MSRYITPPSPLSGGQRTNLLGALRWRAGRAPVVAGNPGEAARVGGAGVVGCSLGGRPRRGGAAVALRAGAAAGPGGPGTKARARPSGKRSVSHCFLQNIYPVLLFPLII